MVRTHMFRGSRPGQSVRVLLSVSATARANCVIGSLPSCGGAAALMCKLAGESSSPCSRWTH